MFPTPPRHKELKGKEKRSRIQEEVRAAVEEGRTSRAAGMGQQGDWTRWEQAMDRKVTWTELWQSEPHRITFLIWAVYDVLPSPANLCMWGKADTPTCQLCPARGTLETHSEFLPNSARPGSVHLVSQPGAEIYCRHHQQRDQQRQPREQHQLLNRIC